MKQKKSILQSVAIKKFKRKIIINIRKFLFPIIYHKRVPAYNIYHCCIQKTATQWFSKLLNDKIIWKNSGFSLYYPGENFISNDRDEIDKLQYIPQSGIICSPLYIRYKNFIDFTHNRPYKAFYIIRDPRDIVISNYFSIRFSHPNIKEYIDSKRKELESLTEHDGISKIIIDTAKFYTSIMHEWKLALDENIKVYKFEDVFGQEQHLHLSSIFDHCNLSIPASDIQYLVDQYSFSKMSGRKPGTEDKKHHYRKGVSGDWKNYFSQEHKRLFKQQTGELLIGLGYESDLNW